MRVWLLSVLAADQTSMLMWLSRQTSCSSPCSPLKHSGQSDRVSPCGHRCHCLLSHLVLWGALLPNVRLLKWSQFITPFRRPLVAFGTFLSYVWVYINLIDFFSFYRAPQLFWKLLPRKISRNDPASASRAQNNNKKYMQAGCWEIECFGLKCEVIGAWDRILAGGSLQE